MLTRVEGWEKILENFMEERKNNKYKFGKHDCCITVCDLVLEMTGVDLAKGFRGYKSKKKAKEILERYKQGVESIAEQVAKEYKISEWPSVAFARRGDVVLFEHGKRKTLGFVGLDARYAHFADEIGFSTTLVLNCKRAWQIG